MKKTFRNITLGLLLAAFTFTFASCGYEPVFYGIMHDVAQEEATVTGNITTIVRGDMNGEEYLFLSNGGSLIYKKASSSRHGDWTSKNIKLPFSIHHYDFFSDAGHNGHQILKVVGDDDYIYLLTATFAQNNEYGVVLPNKLYFWACAYNDLTSGNPDWKDVAAISEETQAMFPFTTTAGYVSSGFNLFFTNAPQADHRAAFLCVTGEDTKYYRLNGKSAPTECTSEVTGNLVKTDDSSTKANSAFYIGNNLKFADSYCVTTNETATPIQNATYAYLAGVSSGSYSTAKLFTYDGTTDPVFAVSAGSTITSLAATGNSILIGKGSYINSITTNGGIDRVLLDTDGKPESSLAAFTNNAKYQFTSSYILMTLLCADPSLPEEEATLYTTISFKGSSSSSSASFNDIGLWSYYPSRGNWNRE